MKHVYLIGIGGIGMSAIARYYKFKGLDVSGYDRTPSALTEKLIQEGIPVHYEDDASRMPADIQDTLVIYTPAIPETLGELRHARQQGYKLIKRSRALGEICQGQTCLAVAGTHGKTTTSTLVAHILTESGEGCSAFLGGISKNYGTNLLMSRTPTVHSSSCGPPSPPSPPWTPTIWTSTETSRTYRKPSGASRDWSARH